MAFFKEISRSVFDARMTLSAIIRAYSTQPEYIPERIEFVRRTVEKLISLGIKSIEVLVWSDPRYHADCGQLAPRLRKEIGKSGVFISEVKYGDLFCAVSNYGVARAPKDFAMFLSPEALEFLTLETYENMVEALCKGALVSGVQIPRFGTVPVSNELAIWNRRALQTVGGFSPLAIKPLPGQERKIRVGDYTYPITGSEDSVTQALMATNFGPCIAQVPAPRGARLISSRHLELREKAEAKDATKAARQQFLLERFGFSMERIHAGAIN